MNTETTPQILPVITLYQPWATWIMRGWKTIETRTHSRFACLKGKRILIHSGMKTDVSAINNPYLTEAQIKQDPDAVVNGYILGEAVVSDFKMLDGSHSRDSLINCDIVERYGLFLTGVQPYQNPIEVKGEMGIWYYDLTNRQKVKKSQAAKPVPDLFIL